MPSLLDRIPPHIRTAISWLAGFGLLIAAIVTGLIVLSSTSPAPGPGVP